MEFHVLGSLAVRDAAGTEVPLPRDEQRVLLAALLLNHGRVVPRDRLLELLPASALDDEISQLRTLLGGDRIELRGRGLVLAVADDELDVRRFEAAVAAGRFREALALWRGTPYADLEEQPFVHAERERLRELRLVALEGAIAADVDAGRAAEAVSELEALVEELYRSGRQADALTAYRAVRSAYVEELGIEPSAELQQLERRILHQDAPRRTTALPTGTVTFVFTDIERSTDLLHELGAEAYAELLAEHHRRLRAVVAEHDGVHVDTQGDGSFAAFARATDALGAAAAMHRDAPMRIRIGIHTGEPVVTENGYVGADVHLAARIAGAGHGGQTLLSNAARALAHDAPLHDLGEHRFRGFAQRERVWQLGGDDFPPLRAAPPPNLPAAAPTLYGRDEELVQIEQLFRGGAQLVTLTGAGGAGKTQLALHAARRLDGLFADGVFFVDLAPLTDSALVPAAIAHALGVAESVLDETLLRGNRLVVLDNAEHLAGVGEVLAPQLGGATAFLVTSRAPLQIRFEQQLEVEPLADAAAVQLFVARAAAVGRELDVDEAVRALCRQLDNLPLALELAAARAKHLDPQEILEHGALAPAPADAPERQRTLRNTIDWSVRLLAPEEQRALRALAVFNGGWTLEAAEHVARTSVDVLASLVDQSLVRRRPGRFDMLETIRSYAAEQIPADVERRHAEYFTAFAERAAAELTGPGQRVALRRLDLDVDNLRAALDWGRAHDGETVARLTDALRLYWSARGLHSEARRWIEAALAGRTDDPDLLFHAGHFARADGDLVAARRAWERGLAVSEQGRFLMTLGQVDSLLGNFEIARSRLERALALQADDERARSLTLVSLGAVELELGDFARAEELIAEGVRGLRAVADETRVAAVLPALAYLEARNGRPDEGRATSHEALELAAGLEAWRIAAWALLAAAYVEARTAPVVAAHSLGAAEAAYAENGWPWEAADARVREDAIAILGEELEGDALLAGRRAGARGGLPHAINVALADRRGDLVQARAS